MFRKRAAATLAAAGALVMSSGLVLLNAPAASASGNGAGGQGQDSVKVLVCKYVGTPGVDEHLKKGAQPISVSASTLPSDYSIGSYFADDHGRSFVLALDDGLPHQASECPASDGPAVTYVSITVTPHDVCGTQDDSWTVTSDHDGSFDTATSGSAATGTVTLTFTPHTGFALDTPGQVTLTFTDVPCQQDPTHVSITVTPHDSCGTQDDSWTVTSDHDGSFDTATSGSAASGTVTLTFTPHTGYAIDTDSTVTLTFTNVPCDGPTDNRIAVVPVKPTWNEATCSAGPSITYNQATGVKYVLEGTVAPASKVKVTGVVTDATLYKIEPGTTTWWEHTFQATPTDCGSDNPSPGDPTTPGNPTPGDPTTPGNPTPGNPVVVSPLYPTVNPATCTADGSLNLPTQPAGVLVEQTGDVPGDVSFHFTPAAGYVFPAGTVTDVTLTVAPRKTGTACGEVLGTESSKPKPTSHTHAAHPSRAPTVLGTEAVVPTAVDAGLATWPGTQPAASERGGLLAQGLLGGGLLLLVAAGCLGLGLRSRGGHEF